MWLHIHPNYGDSIISRKSFGYVIREENQKHVIELHMCYEHMFELNDSLIHVLLYFCAICATYSRTQSSFNKVMFALASHAPKFITLK